MTCAIRNVLDSDQKFTGWKMFDFKNENSLRDIIKPIYVVAGTAARWIVVLSYARF